MIYGYYEQPIIVQVDTTTLTASTTVEILIIMAELTEIIVAIAV